MFIGAGAVVEVVAGEVLVGVSRRASLTTGTDFATLAAKFGAGATMALAPNAMAAALLAKVVPAVVTELPGPACSRFNTVENTPVL